MSSRAAKYSGLLVAALLMAGSGPAQAADVEDAVLAEINFARGHPQEYAERLRVQPVSDWEAALSANSPPTDPGARDEAIAFLMAQPPLLPLRAHDALASAALEHVRVQGSAGRTGHAGPQGERFDQRLRRHGAPAGLAAENIAYGPPSAPDVVRELIIDSGVASRGHRRNIFGAAFNLAGVGCGPHRDYATMCVIDFGAAKAGGAGWMQAALSPETPRP